jgi:hypothetical protein
MIGVRGFVGGMEGLFLGGLVYGETLIIIVVERIKGIGVVCDYPCVPKWNMCYTRQVLGCVFISLITFGTHMCKFCTCDNKKSGEKTIAPFSKREIKIPLHSWLV